jgi:transcriptional regulator with XRE-family HTH domain
MLTPESLKMARAAVGWDQRELAQRSGVSTETVKRAEGDPNANLSKSTIDAIANALTRAGVLMETSFKRGLVVRLTKTAEAKKRILDALAKDGTEAEKIQRAEAVVADYRQMAQAFYEGEPEARERIRSWLQDLKDVLRGEVSYFITHGHHLTNSLDKFVEDRL